MLVIKKRSKLTKSLMAGVVMFSVGLSGSVAYLDATTPSWFAPTNNSTPLTKAGSSAGEIVASQTAMGDPSTDATSSSSDQPSGAIAFAPAPTEPAVSIASHAAATVADGTSVFETAPIATVPEEPSGQDPSLLEGVILPLLP